MKGLKLIALMLAALMAAFPVFAGATGSLALFSTSGTVEFSDDGTSWKAAQSGQSLVSPQKIRTGNGTAQLKFADGTLINMKENSMIDLVQANCDGVKQDSVLKLWYGMLKAKVTKLQPGSRFEAHTPKVVAAVKGTEFILETTADASVLSVLEGLVALSDILREKQVFVKENERSAFHEGVFETPREMSPDEVSGLKGGFETGMLNRRASGAPSSGREDFSPAELQEIKDLKKDLADVKSRANLENKLDMLDQIADIQLGKTLVDMHGYQVRSENYILRPTPDSMMMLNITKRSEGPNAGITSLEITDVFNKNLPDNFIDVKIALARQTWTQMPEYFYKSETSALRNPYGDSIIDLLTYQAPIQLSNGNYSQQLVETFSIDNSQKWLRDYDPARTNKNLYQDATGSTLATDMPYTVKTDSILDASGNLIGMRTTDTYKDSTTMSKDMYLINDLGTPQDLLAMFLQPNFLANIYNFNWELVWTATAFSGRSIDMVVIPQIFGDITF